MKGALLSKPIAPITSGFPRLLRSPGDSDFTETLLVGNANVALRPELESLSQSPNKAMALEAESVFNELLAKMDKGGHQISDPKVIQFVQKALGTNDRSFSEKLPSGTEVSFSKNNGINFSFYETRTQTAEAIERRNLGKRFDERLPEQNTRNKVQTGMLTIQKFGDDDIRISVSEINKQASRMKGFSLAV